jgi:hypothetical protein
MAPSKDRHNKVDSRGRRFASPSFVSSTSSSSTESSDTSHTVRPSSSSSARPSLPSSPLRTRINPLASFSISPPPPSQQLGTRESNCESNRRFEALACCCRCHCRSKGERWREMRQSLFLWSKLIVARETWSWGSLTGRVVKILVAT